MSDRSTLASRVAVYVAASLVTAACGQGAARTATSSVETSEEIARAVNAVNSALNAKEYAPACDQPMPPESPSAVIGLTAETCLSCRNIGFLVRRLKALETSKAISVALVMPADDTEDVCRYMKSEKVSVTSLKMNAEALPDPTLTTDGVFIVRRQGYVVHSQRLNRNVFELEADSLIDGHLFKD